MTTNKSEDLSELKAQFHFWVKGNQTLGKPRLPDRYAKQALVVDKSFHLKV